LVSTEGDAGTDCRQSRIGVSRKPPKRRRRNAERRLDAPGEEKATDLRPAVFTDVKDLSDRKEGATEGKGRYVEVVG